MKRFEITYWTEKNDEATDLSIILEAETRQEAIHNFKMQNINYALLAKAEKSLNVKMLYDEGIFTKKEWIKLKFKHNGKLGAKLG